MEKIEVKDIKKTLNKKIKEIKNQKLALPKKLLEKTTNGYIKLRDKVRNYVPEEVKKEENKKEIESLTKKIERKENIVSLMKQSEDYDFGVGAGRLKEVKEEISKLRKKRIKREKKGLGVFALLRLTLNQIKTNSESRAFKLKEQYELSKNKTELENDVKLKNNTKLELDELKQKQEDLKNKINEIHKNTTNILNQNTELNSFYSELIGEKKDNIYKSVVKEISSEEKNKIKSTKKYSKALASLALAAGITVATPMASTNVEDIDIIDVSPETIEQVNNIQPTQVSLGGYVNLAEGSKIYESSELSGKVGLIGLNGYTDNTLFKINGIKYLDKDNNIKTFDLIQKTDNQKSLIINEYNNFINNNKEANILSFHITPCNEYGIIDPNELELGGWTNNTKSNIKVVSAETILKNAQSALQNGKKLS